MCAALTRGAAVVLSRTRFGSRLRAAVDDPRVARGLGINVNVVFLTTFAVGSGLAGLGGALGAEILGLDPTFPLKFMIYFLIVVAVGGTSSITGPLLAALLLGIADVAGKYYIPKMGAFIVYALMIVILMLAPAGPVRRAGGAMSADAMPTRTRARAAARRRPRRAWEFAFWARGLRGLLLLPRTCAADQRDRDRRAVRASLDLILGYAGIVSLGHAAFFGFGAYAAALFAKHVMPDPLVGLLVAIAAAAALGALPSFTDAARQRPHAADGDAGRRAASCWNWPTSSTGSPAAPTACRAW